MTDNTPRLVRATLLLMLVGATLGSALDAIHSHFGAVSYTHPVFARAAWWVPLLFCGAYGTGVVRLLLAWREPPPPGCLRSTHRTRWPLQDRPFGDVIAWANVELTKSAAEIGYARFLYAVRTRLP